MRYQATFDGNGGVYLADTWEELELAPDGGELSLREDEPENVLAGLGLAFDDEDELRFE